MKKLSTALGMAAIAVSIPVISHAANTQQTKTKTQVEKMVSCPKDGTIIDNQCYVDSRKKPIFSSDPTAKPICYPGIFIKTSTGYTCLMKYNDYKNPQ